MPIVIKEIHVNTVVEKKVIRTTDISEQVYRKIKAEIIRELSKRPQQVNLPRRKNER